VFHVVTTILTFIPGSGPMRLHPLALGSVLVIVPMLGIGAQQTTLHINMTARASADTTPPAARAPMPLLSPRDTTRTTIGDAHVLIDYGRPSKRNRVIFGGLVPYDKVWRTGANAATTLVTDKDLVIGGTTVPAGTYTLYTLPGKTAWQLIINKQTGQWGTVYNQAQDFARIPMQVASLATPIEKFEMVFPGDGRLHLRWDTTDASVPVAVASASKP